MKKLTVNEKEAGRRLDRYLQMKLPDAGLSFLCKMLRKKNITLNGKKAEPSARIETGDSIEIFFSDETYDKFAAASAGHENESEALPDEYINGFRTLEGIKIIYEDDDFIFIDKPPGILSQKADRKDFSVNEWLVGYLMDKKTLSADEIKTFKPAFANRLDRNTSGLMLGGKTLKALQTLSGLIRDRDVRKFYICEASGIPDEGFPVREDGFLDITGFLYKDEDTNTVRVFGSVEEAEAVCGKDCKDRIKTVRTGFKLLNRSDDSMLLEVELYTGRSHQIRAQLKALGHPITGDMKYGKGKKGSFQQLHAYRIVFPEVPGYPAISNREFMTDQAGRINA